MKYAIHFFLPLALLMCNCSSPKNKQSMANTPVQTSDPGAKDPGVSDPGPVEARQMITLSGFESKVLGNTRDIFIRLPDSYATSADSYPVVYMHDGQNIFSPGGPFGCWYVENAVKALTDAHAMKDVIIVGIGNTSARIPEYNYGDFYDVNGAHQTGGVESYAQFVMTELMPCINEQFRTRTGPANTAIVGSSYGGMASLYFAWFHSDVFGMAGCFSSTLRYLDPTTSQWLETPLLRAIKESSGPKKPVRFWLYAGDREKLDPENDGMYNYAEWTYSLAHTLLGKGWVNEDDLLFEIGRNETHSETSWSKYAGKPFQFFFGTDTTFTPTALSARLTASDLDLDKVAKASYLLAKVSYANGLTAEVPFTSLTSCTIDRPTYLDNAQGVFSLAEGVSITPPVVVNITAAYKGFESSAALNIVQNISTEVPITFTVTTPDNSGDTIYLIGSFCSWKFSGAVVLNKTGSADGKSTYVGTTPLKKGAVVEFKFCAGSAWSYEEQTAEGASIPNRKFEVGTSPTKYEGTVLQWKAVP